MITIGITTYNRKNILETMANSLYKSDLNIPHNIRIYDDRSTEYGKEFLEELFPTAKTIKINTCNLKADRNIYQMYADFLTTNDDYFFNADSDILFNNQWLNISLELIKKTDGILSLFNANSHKHYEIIDDIFCLKKTVGSAGTLFTRSRVIEIINNFDSIEKADKFDWKWSNYFSENNIKIYCLNNSLVQHIGYNGQNSGYFFDIGRNYKIENIEDGQIINDIFVDCMDKIIELDKKNIERENNFFYHLYRCIIIIGKIIIPINIRNKLKQRKNKK